MRHSPGGGGRSSGRVPSANVSVDSVASPDPDPEQQTYAVELSTLLDAALGRLPAGYRAVFMLREVHGLNTTDTAERLRLSEGTVRTRLHRAKDLLQRNLQNLMPPDVCRFDGARCDRLVDAVMRKLRDPEFLVLVALHLKVTSETQPDRPSELP